MTTLDIRPVDATGIDITLALSHLAAAGVTADVLAADGVDPTNAAQLRDLIDDLLASALAENSITGPGQVCDLQAALDALTSDDEREHLDAMANAIRARLAGQRFTLTAEPALIPVYGSECLDAE